MEEWVKAKNYFDALSFTAAPRVEVSNLKSDDGFSLKFFFDFDSTR